MPRPPETIIADIDAFEPVEGNWLPLDTLVGELFEAGNAMLGVPALLRVFERFPNDDGAGVFWAVLHGLESVSNYECAVLEAVGRKPTEFAVLMFNRMLNGGIQEIGNIPLLRLLSQVAADGNAGEGVRAAAASFVQYQESKGD